MTIGELAQKINATVAVAAGKLNSQFHGCYCGDFLSNVMGRAQADQAWFTVMTNVNVAGVATLTDVACVVVCEGFTPDPVLVDRCREKDICLLATALPVFEASAATVAAK